MNDRLAARFGRCRARLLGYHAVSLGGMSVDDLTHRPRGAPRHREIPVLFFGQAAVDKAAQVRGLGSILMHHVFEKARNVSGMAGCHAIIPDVFPDGGDGALARRKGCYEGFGFTTFDGNPGCMFPVTKQVRALVT